MGTPSSQRVRHKRGDPGDHLTWGQSGGSEPGSLQAVPEQNESPGPPLVSESGRDGQRGEHPTRSHVPCTPCTEERGVNITW